MFSCIKVSLKIALAIYIGLTALLFVAQDKLIFPGAKNNPENISQLKKYYPDSFASYTVDDLILHGWYLNKAANKPLVIYYGGNAEDISPLALQLAPLDYFKFLLVDYRGYGNSGGEPSEALVYQDALAVYDTVYNQAIKRNPEQKVFLIGRSLGTGVATYVASQRKVNGLVLITPYDSITAVAQNRYPFAPVNFLIKHRFDSLSRAQKLTMPTLVLMAESDQVVPHKHTENLLNKLPNLKETKTLKNTNHNNIADSAEFIPLIKQFLIDIK